ncbi:MAG: hypothetical protein AAGI11_21255 [Pseudomonadota bacterium]
METEFNIDGPDKRLAALARIGGAHLLLALVLVIGARWLEDGLPTPALVLALAAGFISTTFIHEWFHLTGARLSGGSYTIPRRLGLFTYDWDFAKNSLNQFYLMSLAGSLGSVAGIALFWINANNSAVGFAMLAGSWASLGFAATIEWPVLWRTVHSGDPYGELAKINGRVLLASLSISAMSGTLAWWLLQG